MEIMQFYLQDFRKLTINGEYSVELPDNSYLIIKWFPHNDLIIESGNKKFKLNSDTIKQEQSDCLIIKIDEKTYIIRPEKTHKMSGEYKIDFEKGNTIIANNCIIDKKTNEYVVADKIDITGSDFVALRHLKTKLGHTEVIKSNERYLVRDKNNNFLPKTHKEITLCFLECLHAGDFITAGKFLSFITNKEQLKRYFGEFEILEFMDEIYIYTPKKFGFTEAKKPKFEITNDRIDNIEVAGNK
jgi:hypothetical protein